MEVARYVILLVAHCNTPLLLPCNCKLIESFVREEILSTSSVSLVFQVSTTSQGESESQKSYLGIRSVDWIDEVTFEADRHNAITAHALPHRRESWPDEVGRKSRSLADDLQRSTQRRGIKDTH